jgi:N-methylhydantoinase A/oxoprolinase/acetone carboxylase beta subunit
VVRAFDCRYVGQSHELSVPDIDQFHAEHERRNGYARPDAPVEVIAVRASARVASPVSAASLPVPSTASRTTSAVGPTVIAEPDCTIWVADGWSAEPHPSGALVLSHAGAPS